MKFLYVIVAAFVLGAGASVLGNYYVKYRYEINENISRSVIEQIYGETLDRIESIYEIKGDNNIEERVAFLKSELPRNLGILTLYQRDKGIDHMSYGVRYFGYERENYQSSYFYTNSSRRSVANSMRGYVEKQNGSKIAALKYERNVSVDGKSLDIELIVYYQKLVELANAL